MKSTNGPHLVSPDRWLQYSIHGISKVQMVHLVDAVLECARHYKSDIIMHINCKHCTLYGMGCFLHLKNRIKRRDDVLSY